MPTLTFATLAAWQTWVDNNIITNGMELITGDDGNITENAAIYFITRSPLNWQTADIASAGGVVNVTRPITVIMTVTPTSISWADNIYNEYVFINTTLGDVPTTVTYYDINLTAVNKIPAKSVINICKAKNGNWILKSLPASGSGVIVPALNGVVGGGGIDDPVNGSPTFQSNKLINLGATSGGKISITYAETPMSNYGDNAAFTLDNVTGIMTWLNGNTFNSGSSLYINLNQ